MALGRGDKIERDMDNKVYSDEDKPWKYHHRSRRIKKKWKHRRERQRVRLNPDCPSEYKKYIDDEY